MSHPAKPHSSRQHSLLRQHDARARQLLPFVRTRLTNLQRSRLIGAFTAASSLDSEVTEDAQDKNTAQAIMSGAALVACSLETSHSIHQFLSAKISLEVKSYDPSRHQSESPGIYLSQTGTMGWQLDAGGPKLKASTAGQMSPADIWLPMSEVTSALIRKTGVSLDNMVADYKAANLKSPQKNLIRSLLRPFAKWCRRKFGQVVSFNILNKVASDLAYRLANAPQSDAAIARVITGKLRRETISTSHYTSLTRQRAARHVVDTLKSLRPPTTYMPNALENIPEPDLLVGAPRKRSDAQLAEVMDQLSQLQVPGSNAPLETLINFHNAFTLRVLLMTSMAIGARHVKAPLLNPDNILPGQLVLVNDKEAKNASDPDLDDRQLAALVPKTRVVALPDHVAEQIRAYGEHMNRLRTFFETGSRPQKSIENWFKEHRANARWEPLYWLPGKDTANGRKPCRLVCQSKLHRHADNANIIEQVDLVRGNHWRHYFRAELLERVPCEIIDAHLGHWQEAQGPWWQGACLDPVETWCRIREAVEMLLPAAKWPVLKTPLREVMYPASKALAVHGVGVVPADENQEPPISAGAEPSSQVSSSHTPLIDLFNPDRSGPDNIAFFLEQRHLTAIEHFAKDGGKQGSVRRNNWPGLILVSAMLWAGLITPATWKPFLEALFDTKRRAGHEPLTKVRFSYDVGNTNWSLPQTVYLDPITSWLSSAWSPGPHASIPDALTCVQDWVNATCAPENAETPNLDEVKLRDALELRARLRLPAILVDYASGRNPSPAWEKKHQDGVAKFPDDSPHYSAEKKFFAGILKGEEPNYVGAPKLRAAIDYLLNPMAKAHGAEAKDNELLAVAKMETDRRDKLREVYRESLNIAFNASPLFKNNWKITAECTLEEVVGRFLLETATSAARRMERHLYREEILEPAHLLYITRQCYRLLQRRLPDTEKLALAEHLEPGNPLARLLETEGFGQTPINRKDQTEAIAALVHAWIKPIYHVKKTNRLERGLAEALCRIANLLCDDSLEEQSFNNNLPDWTNSALVRLHQKETGKDPRAMPSRPSYPLVTAEQFAQALSNLGNITDIEMRMTSSASSKAPVPDPKRRADICRIATILMYRAGVRPYELSGIMLGDLSMLCADKSGDEVSDPEAIRSADLLITANYFLKQKTRLSRRLIPLDVLLEPAELALLRKWQSVRLIEAGGRTKNELLFELAPGDPTRKTGKRLNANWILVPIANALMMAGCENEFEKKAKENRKLAPHEAHDFCYRLRHTAATCLLATLLLLKDAALPASARLDGFVPALISPAGRTRLTPRLLGAGQSGRTAAHAVARIMGHSDLVSLRSTYAHLMDWSLGMACSRPAIQPPLSREVLTQASRVHHKHGHTKKCEINPATMREDARRHHLSIFPVASNGDPKFKLMLPQYKRVGQGQRNSTARAGASVDCGYLGPHKDTGFARLPRSGIVRDLDLFSTPQPYDVADLVIRSTKSGLSLANIAQRFGVKAQEAQRMLTRWGELVQIEGVLRRKITGPDQEQIETRAFRLFQPFEDKHWNSLASVPVQSVQNPFSASFRKYSHALTTLAVNEAEPHDGFKTRSARHKSDRAIRMLLTRRNPHYGSYNLLFEKGRDVRRYLEWFRQRIKASAGDAVLFTAKPIDRYNPDQPLRVLLVSADGKSAGATKTLWPRNAGGWRYEEPAASRWAAYAVLLNVVASKQDMKPLLQAAELNPSSVNHLVACLSSKNVTQERRLPIWVGRRLYSRLSRAETDCDKRSSGLANKVPAQRSDGVYPFRIISLDGRVAAGVISRSDSGLGAKDDLDNLTLSGHSWLPRRYSATQRCVIPFGTRKISIARLKDETLAIFVARKDADDKTVELVRRAANCTSHTEAPTAEELCWYVDPSDSDLVEAHLFAGASAGPVLWTTESSKRRTEIMNYRSMIRDVQDKIAAERMG